MRKVEVLDDGHDEVGVGGEMRGQILGEAGFIEELERLVLGDQLRQLIQVDGRRKRAGGGRSRAAHGLGHLGVADPQPHAHRRKIRGILPIEAAGDAGARREIGIRPCIDL